MTWPVMPLSRIDDTLGHAALLKVLTHMRNGVRLQLVCVL
jgi:hypothetical protein